MIRIKNFFFSKNYSPNNVLSYSKCDNQSSFSKNETNHVLRMCFEVFLLNFSRATQNVTSLFVFETRDRGEQKLSLKKK